MPGHITTYFRVTFLFALCILGFSGTGCTFALWREWLPEPKFGKAVGVLRNRDGEDHVVYDFEEVPGWGNGQYAFRIPTNWTQSNLETDQIQGMHALLEGLTVRRNVNEFHDGMSGIRIANSLKEILNLPTPAKGHRSYAIIRVLQDDGSTLHELLGFHTKTDQWILLGTINVGVESGHLALKLVLSPIAIVLDAGLLAVVIFVVTWGAFPPI